MKNPMKRFDLRVVLLAAGATAFLNGCSSWFPDKQKQYQYSSEIPPLEIPPDLLADSVEGAVRGRRPAEAAIDTGRSPEDTPSAEKPAETPSPETAATDSSSGFATPDPHSGSRRSAPSGATLAQNVDDVPLVEIDESFALAWNDVSKALGRIEVEVTDQNRTEGLYFVYFSAEQNVKDTGIWGDMKALFGSGPEPAQEFQVKLEEKGAATMISVLDKDGKPQTEGQGLELLKRLHQTLLSMAQTQGGEKPGSDTGDQK